jgi:hypothetical protein
MGMGFLRNKTPHSPEYEFLVDIFAPEEVNGRSVMGSKWPEKKETGKFGKKQDGFNLGEGARFNPR